MFKRYADLFTDEEVRAQQRAVQDRRREWERERPPFHIYGIFEVDCLMKQESVRTTVDIPEALYRKLKEQASASGRSIGELVLAGRRDREFTNLGSFNVSNRL